MEFGVHAYIARQARVWLVRMDGDEPLTGTELEALREWMGRSPLHREEIRRVAKFWDQSNVLTKLVAFPNSELRERVGRGGRRPRVFLAFASAFLASILLVWWFYQRSDGVANGAYRTALGRQQTIALPDGSSIQLNTDSQVQVGYTKHSRRIRLLRGEALFVVTPDVKRAFEVYVADNVVRAVGTAFAVHLDGSAVDVTVTKGVVDVAEVGSVQAKSGDQPFENGPPQPSLGRLKAGQISTFGSGVNHIDVHQLAEPELRRRMAWREGYLAFSGEPLSEVIEQVNRYSPVILQIGDPKLVSIPIGGRFRIGDLDAILDVLQTNFGIHSYRVNERNIRLESERPR
jgi:transmembrane sensor